MTNFVPLNRSGHAGKAWRPFNSFSFALAQAVVPLVGAEFGKAAVAMPIAFVEHAGGYAPVAVMSPIAGRNFFIGPQGQWLGAYAPAALRSYPFQLTRVEGVEDSVLCIDEDSGLVIDADGAAEDFFDADGNPSPATKAMLDFLLENERNRTLTDLAVAALVETGLIQPWPLSVKVADQITPFNGLFRIDETAMSALDDAYFLKLRKSGALPLAYMQLLSVAQTAVLEQLNRIQDQLVPLTNRQASLDEIFATADSGILRFN
jgi:SapC